MAFEIDTNTEGVAIVRVSGEVSVDERAEIARSFMTLSEAQNSLPVIVDYRQAKIAASPSEASEFAHTLSKLTSKGGPKPYFIIPSEEDRHLVDISVATLSALYKVDIYVCEDVPEALEKIAARKKLRSSF